MLVRQLRIFLFLACLLPSAVVLPEDSGVNFQDADIRGVIEAVSKATGKNFIVDPRVKGRVTLVSSGDIEPDNLYDVFLSILKVHGFIAVEDEDTGVVSILPANESRTSADLSDEEGASDEILVKVLKINNTKASELVPILRPLISKTGHLAAHIGSNNIIITDTRANINKMQAIVNRMDNISQSEIKVVKLKNAAAEEVARILNEVLTKGSGSGPGDPNSVSSSFSMVAEERTNSVVLKGNKIEIARAYSLLQELDSPVNIQSGTAVIKLKYAQAKDIVEIINKILSNSTSGKEGAVVNASAVQVSVDEKVNSVVVIGPPKEVDKIRSIVNKLDVKRSQILVEALVVELSATKAKQLGVQWGAVFDDGDADIGVSPSDLKISPGLSAIIGGIKAGDHLTFGIVARALANDSDANLISAPSLLTLENEEATIEIGQEVPFKTGSYTSTGGGGGTSPENPFTTINRENVGLKLKITPQINKGGNIKLAIEQEISSVLPGTTQTEIGAADIVTSKRSINTNVIVKDGHMLVLGGLIDDNARESESNTPGLSKIPILGYLFRNRDTNIEKRNLMIFIRPYIVKNERVKNLLTKNRYNYVRDLQLKKHKKGVALYPELNQPVIRNLYDSTAKPKVTKRKTRGDTNPEKKRIKPFFKNKGEDYDVLNPQHSEQNQPVLKTLYGSGATPKVSKHKNRAYTRPERKRIKSFFKNKGEDYDVLNPQD